MGDNSNIAWTDHTFNPWVGCTKVSPACDNCYAEGWAKRSGLVQWGPHERRRTSTANWRKPLKWNAEAQVAGRRAKVFCASLADVFDNDRSITSGWRGDLWDLIDQTPNLDWLLLTKRPQNIYKMLPDLYGLPEWGSKGWSNVWLGTTAENQEEADRRIPHLLEVPAAQHFCSAEPLLGKIRFAPWLDVDARTGSADDGPFNTLDWIIVGGESGPGHRPMQIEWAEDTRQQCKDAGTAFFFKQDSGPKPGQRGRASDELWACKEFPS